MADYSEIAVQIEGRIPYVGLYRNFSYKGIMLEAVEFAADYCDCKTIDQLCRRIYKKPLSEDDIYGVEANIEYEADDVYIVDLDHKVIYNYDEAVYNGGAR